MTASAVDLDAWVRNNSGPPADAVKDLLAERELLTDEVSGERDRCEAVVRRLMPKHLPLLTQRIVDAIRKESS